MNKIKVILVDDHELVRMGFRLLLEGANNLEVIAEFSSGEEVVNNFLNYEFDLIVIDISMPGIGGIEAIKRILLKKPKTKILVLSAHEDDLHANRVLKAGAKGYLTKKYHGWTPDLSNILLQNKHDYDIEIKSLEWILQ